MFGVRDLWWPDIRLARCFAVRRDTRWSTSAYPIRDSSLSSTTTIPSPATGSAVRAVHHPEPASSSDLPKVTAVRARALLHSLPIDSNLFFTRIDDDHALAELNTGMRKGAIDSDAGVITVSRSHDRDIPKGGCVEAVLTNEELVPYSRRR